MTSLLSLPPLTGTVLDGETKEPLPYANILVKGKYKGTVANGEGYFVFDLEGTSPDDTLLISYMGYESFQIRVVEFSTGHVVALRPAAVNLDEVQVIATKLSAKQIVEMVEKNYVKNYSTYPHKQRLFCHKVSRFPMKKDNQLVVKKSDFAGIDKATFNELFKKLPSEFNGYQDAIVDFYSYGGRYKLLPVQAVSLEEGSQEALWKEFESKLGVFMADYEKSKNNKDIYYKIRTGILSQKLDKDNSDWNAYKEDTLNYTMETGLIKGELLFLYDDYAHLESKNWEFIHSPNKYDYVLEETTVLNGEQVYKISFLPQKRGLFKGVLYVSATNYAILEMDFAFAPGKQTEKFQLMGIGHSMNFKGGHVIFEKGTEGYHVKYLSAHQKESASIHRDFSILKKQKRFFVDKELNEMKLEVQISFDVENTWELLLLDQEKINLTQFEKAVQPATMKFKKEHTHSPERWGHNSFLAPSSELKKYKRK